MDDLELYNEDSIRDSVADRLESIVESFSILTIGHITKFRDPINRGLGMSETLDLFASLGDEVNSIPVEGDRGVIGIIQKKHLLKRKTALRAVTDPALEKLFDFSALSIEADENCEMAMVKILKRDPESLYDDFMIYRYGKFFGIGTFAELSRNISEIRSVDLEKAKRMQEFLMARNAVGNPRIVVETLSRMAHMIGGDYLECMDINERLSMVSTFDVSGKGIAAALLTSIISSFFSTLKVSGALASMPPGEILATLNRVIIDQTPEEIFIAGAFAFIDDEKRETTLFNCGYSPLFAFYTDEESGKTKGKMIKSDLWPLGINEYEGIKGSVFPIHRNMRVFMYSDGLTEARNESGEQYGEERLKKFLFPRCMKRAKAIMGELDDEISGFIASAPQADDITVLIAEIG